MKSNNYKIVTILRRDNMYIALKEFKKEKLRFSMILLVIVLITFLVYFLSSLAFGLSQLNRTAIDHWGADGVIISESSNKNLLASTIDLKKVEYLSNNNFEFVSISSANASINGSESTSLIFMGFEDEKDAIIPNIIEGSIVSQDFEILISANIKEQYDVKVGDTLKISDTKREFTIKGFTDNSNYNTVPVVYGKQDMISNLMMNYDTSTTQQDANTSATPNMPKRISFVLVKDEAKLNVSDISEELVYIDIKTLINELPGYKAQILTFGLMIGSLSVIVAIIMGIFMYILTMQKKPIFAVMKIQGYQNTTIISSIVIQIISLIVTGLLISLGINQLAIFFLPSAVPVLLNIKLISIVSLFIMIASLLGAVFSGYSVLKIDPLEGL